MYPNDYDEDDYYEEECEEWEDEDPWGDYLDRYGEEDEDYLEYYYPTRWELFVWEVKGRLYQLRSALRELVTRCYGCHKFNRILFWSVGDHSRCEEELPF